MREISQRVWCYCTSITKAIVYKAVVMFQQQFKNFEFANIAVENLEFQAIRGGRIGFDAILLMIAMSSWLLAISCHLNLACNTTEVKDCNNIHIPKTTQRLEQMYHPQPRWAIRSYIACRNQTKSEHFEKQFFVNSVERTQRNANTPFT